MFFCAISGEVPTDAVVASPSGHVYERRLIEKYIAENGTDPITGGKLELTDLITVKANPSSAPPRPPNFTSVPAILNALQNEWDALVLETFALRQQYNATRQELSHGLYQQDAATRVVARLVRERDAARDALASVQASMGVAPAAEDVEMAEDPGTAVPDDTKALINDTLETLSATRKKRKMVPEYATIDTFRSFQQKQSIPSLHGSSAPGINSFALSSKNPTTFVTGGNDKIVQVYDSEKQKVVQALKGHTKKVNHVLLREEDDSPSLIISASADKTARVWGYDDASSSYAPRQTFKTHKGDVIGLALHPSKKLLALASVDKTFSLHDANTLQTVYHSTVFDSTFRSLEFHPDGHFLGIGTTDSKVFVIDVRTGRAAAVLTHAGDDPAFEINTLSFSENGWQMAAPGSGDGDVVSLWDLRKVQATMKVDLEAGFSLNKLLYDYSASVLAVGGNKGVRMYTTKKTAKEEIWRFDGGDVVDLAFGDLGQSLWGVGGREVKLWAPQ